MAGPRAGLRPRWSYFLRADTMSQLYTYLEQNPGRRPERLHELSHGESFLEILRTRVNETGFYLMDEPDAPLSFTSSLGLAALLHDLAAAAQAYPGSAGWTRISSGQAAVRRDDGHGGAP